jgi:hypothetical protein
MKHPLTLIIALLATTATRHATQHAVAERLGSIQQSRGNASSATSGGSILGQLPQGLDRRGITAGGINEERQESPRPTFPG